MTKQQRKGIVIICVSLFALFLFNPIFAFLMFLLVMVIIMAAAIAEKNTQSSNNSQNGQSTPPAL